MVLVDSKIHLTQPMQTQTKILEQKICTTQIINGNTSLNLSPAMVEKVSCRKAMIVMKELGISITGIANFLNCSRFTVYRWIKRHKKTGFLDLPRSGGEVIYCEEAHLRIISFYCQKQPLPSCGRWTLRWAALHLKKNPMELNLTPSKSTIHRVLKKNSLKPHQSQYFLHTTDPNFFPKMDNLLELYNNPPKFLFFFDECPGIQIIKRLTPDLRTENMKKRLEEFEYIRNGTMDVFAFLNYANGKIYAECHGDHKKATFLEVFRNHVSNIHTIEPLHYVMDNLSTHNCYAFCQLVAELSGIDCPPEKELNKQAKRVEWLNSDTKRIVIHFTPFHGSWLNLIEIWFGIMGAKVLNESFCSPESFKKAFDSYVDEWNSLLAHPFRWSYDGKGLHEKTVKRFTKMVLSKGEQLELSFISKSLSLMVNIFENYFEKVSSSTWQHLIEAVSLRYESISKIIQKEKRPIRKKKAEDAFMNFNTILNNYNLMKIMAAQRY